MRLILVGIFFFCLSFFVIADPVIPANIQQHNIGPRCMSAVVTTLGRHQKVPHLYNHINRVSSLEQYGFQKDGIGYWPMTSNYLNDQGIPHSYLYHGAFPVGTIQYLTGQQHIGVAVTVKSPVPKYDHAIIVTSWRNGQVCHIDPNHIGNPICQSEAVFMPNWRGDAFWIHEASLP